LVQVLGAFCSAASLTVSQPQPTARRQLDFLKRQAWFILLVTVVAVAVAAAVTVTKPKVYRAHTSIVIGQAGGIFQPQFGNVFQPFTQTMSSLLKSEIVAQTVIRDLNLDKTPKSLLSDVKVATTPNSAVLQVTVDSTDRAYAVRVLRSMASVFTSLVQKKLGGTPKTPGAAGALPPITATVFDPAHASSTPVSPKPTRTIAFAGVIGLALGLVLALLREALDDRLRRDEVEEHFGAPVVAALPRSMLGRSDVGREIAPSFLQAVEPLRLQLSGTGTRGTLVVITSGSSGEGKSTLTANLSVALSLAGQDVICVDADPTPPRLTNYLELRQGDGSASGTQDRADLAASLRDVEVQRDARPLNGGEETAAPLRGAAGKSRTPDLDSAADGKSVGDQPGRIQLLVWGDKQEGLPLAMNDLAAELKAKAAYVVVDSPPLPSSTTLALLSIADETVVITREKKTKKAEATLVRRTLERLQVRDYSIVSFG
jgi:capsular polysaccharide biosynthesis protein/cellulose biosynthesis protein BcsQ